MRDNTIYILDLKEPYWSAGMRYKWEYGDNVGFGIDIDILNQSEEVLVRSKWGEYMVNVKEVMACHNKYNLRFKCKGKTLIIVPRAICNKLTDIDDKAK